MGRLPSNIPGRLTSFVGRADDLAAVAARLEDGRLVSIVGPGGAGKSRLALEVADALAGGYPHGTWVVELDAARSADDVWTALSVALGLPGTPEASARVRVTRHLRDRCTLGILDNGEHVVADLGVIARQLAESCPDLRLLITSRERLRVHGEALWLLEGLPVSCQGREDGAGPRSDAVELFHQRAAAVDPCFERDPGPTELVTDLCRRLDGLPLAIELAAARLDVHSLDEIAGRLADRDGVGFLMAGRSDVPERHASLRAVMASSYDLLSAEEQRVLDRLSVFVGGFDLASAAVVAGHDLPGSRFEDVLGCLVSKSLVSRNHTMSGPVRFRLLETVRWMAATRLDESGCRATVEGRHADHFLRLALQGGQPPVADPGTDDRERLEDDQDNLRAALGHLVATGRVGDGQAMAEVVGRFRDVQGHDAVGAAWSPQRPARSIQLHLFRDAEFWTLHRDGHQPHHVRHLRGLEHLAVLLESPGREVPAAVLGAAASLPGTSAEELADRRTLGALRRRLLDLEAETAEARAHADLAREERVRDEVAEITAYLAAVTGLGGRTRTMPSPAERARVRVRKALRLAMDRIAEVDAEVGLHLHSSVVTGTFCVYRPDPSSVFRWRVGDSWPEVSVRYPARSRRRPVRH